MPDQFMKDMEQRILPFIRDNAMASDLGYNINTDELMRFTTSGARSTGIRRVTLGGVTDLYILDISTSYASISQATGISIQFSLIVGLMVMVLAVLAYSRMSSSVLRPVSQITSVANQIAHLDFSQKCDVDMGGELGVMAESVNTMSDTMQTYIAQLLSLIHI